jgi:hypothetical protein
MPRIRTDDAAKSNDQGRHYTPVPRAQRPQRRALLKPPQLSEPKTAGITVQTAQVGLGSENADSTSCSGDTCCVVTVADDIFDVPISRALAIGGFAGEIEMQEISVLVFARSLESKKQLSG